MNWLATHGFAAFAFASYPLHGPAADVGEDERALAFVFADRAVRPPARRRLEVSEDDEAIALSLLL